MKKWEPKLKKVRTGELIIRERDYKGVPVIKSSDPALIALAMSDALKAKKTKETKVKEIVIRQNHYEGLKALDDWDGPMTLWMILREAFEGVPFDESEDEKNAWWNPNGRGPKAIHAAIAPDILASLSEGERK